jgi:hypothetical protein
MKNQFNKYYITFFYLCSTFVMFADPGTGTDNGDPLEGGDTPAPIDDYIWVLGLLGLVFVFLRLKNILKQNNDSK